MRNTLLLALVILFIASTPSTGQRPTEARIIDGRGATLGPVIDHTNPTVSLDVAGTVVPVLVFPDHLQSALFSQVYFSSSGCTGQAFALLPVASNALYSPMSIVGAENAVYLGPRSAPQSITFASTLIPGVFACQETPGSVDGVVPVQHALDLSPIYYIPPFSLQSQILASAVPATSAWALVALAALLAGLGAVVLMRSRLAAQTVLQADAPKAKRR